MDSSRSLDPRLVSLLTDVQWTAYRLFGVTSQLKAPGLRAEEDAWDWHRPWFCFYLHYGRYETSEHKTMSPIHFKCERLKSALLARTKSSSSHGRCGTGLRLLAIPLRLGSRTIAHILAGPYSRKPLTDSFSRAMANRTGFDHPEHLIWCGRQIPALNRTAENELASWLSSSTNRLMARFGKLQDGASWEEAIGTAWEPLYAPVRLADDTPAAIFGVFGWPYENGPSLTPRATRGNFWELLFVEKGSLNLALRGRTIRLSSGQACLFPPGEDYSASQHEKQGASGVQLTFIGQAGLFSNITLKPLTLQARDREDLRDMCESLFARPEGSRDSLVRLNLLHLLFNLRRGFTMPEKDPSLTGQASRDRHHSAIASVRRYMEEKVGDSFSLDDLARHSGTSVSTLAHTFKELTGISPLQYHLRLKMEFAKKLLRDGNHTVTMVAEKLNFADTAHFSRTFKRLSGVSPFACSRSVRPAAIQQKKETG